MGVRQCPGWEVQSHQEICGPRGREAQGEKESPKVGVGWQLNNGNCMMCHSCGLDLGPHAGGPPGVRKCSFWKGGRKD